MSHPVAQPSLHSGSSRPISPGKPAPVGQYHGYGVAPQNGPTVNTQQILGGVPPAVPQQSPVGSPGFPQQALGGPPVIPQQAPGGPQGLYQQYPVRNPSPGAGVRSPPMQHHAGGPRFQAPSPPSSGGPCYHVPPAQQGNVYMTRPGAPVAQAPYSASASFSAQQQAPPPAAPPQYSYRPAPSSVSAKKQYPPTSSGYREKAHHYKQKASSFIAKATTSIDKRFGLSSSAGNHPPRSRYGQGRSNASNPPPTISGPTNIVHKGPSELLPGQQQPSISGPMNVVHTASASQPHVPSQQQDQLQH